MNPARSLSGFPARPAAIGIAVAGAAVVVVLAALTPGGPLAALALCALAAAALEPWLGVFLGLAVSLSLHADFINLYRLPFLGFSLYAPDAVVLATGIGLVAAAMTGRPAGRSVRLNRPLLVFLAYAYLMCFVALARHLDPREVLADMRPFVHYAAAFAIPVLLVSRVRMRSLIWALLLTSAAGGAYGIYHSLSNQGMVVEDLKLGFARLTGGSEGAYAPMACFGLAVVTLGTAAPLRALAVIQILLTGAATVLTYSRGSWMSLLAGALVLLIGLFLMSPRRVLLALVGLVAGSALVIAALEGLGVPVIRAVLTRSGAATAQHLDLSLIHRLIEYQTVLAAFRGSPVLGTGPGTIFHYFMPGLGWVNRSFTHNSFLYIACKWGAVGLLLYLYFLGDVLIRGWRGFLRSESPERRLLALGCVAALVALAVKALSTWFLNELYVSLWVGILIGTLAAVGRPDEELPEGLR